MDANGSNVVRLTNNLQALDFQPDWGSLADSTEPTLNLPTPITVNATDADGALVEFEVSATDDMDPNPAVSCSHASGSFPIGTTTVTCTATDEAGNTASGSFDVIVQGATEQVTDLKRLV